MAGRQAGRQAVSDTSLSTLLAGMDAHISLRAAELESLRQARAVFAGAAAVRPAPSTNGHGGFAAFPDEDPMPAGPRGRAPKKRKGSRMVAAAPAAHDLVEKILAFVAAAKAPLKGSQIVAAIKAEPHVVMPLLRALVKDGRVVKVGATVSLRYLSPELFERLKGSFES
jgi:hypothetical protein